MIPLCHRRFPSARDVGVGVVDADVDVDVDTARTAVAVGRILDRPTRERLRFVFNTMK